jgi:hypothetical protein
VGVTPLAARECVPMREGDREDAPLGARRRAYERRADRSRRSDPVRTPDLMKALDRRSKEAVNSRERINTADLGSAFEDSKSREGIRGREPTPRADD